MINKLFLACCATCCLIALTVVGVLVAAPHDGATQMLHRVAHKAGLAPCTAGVATCKPGARQAEDDAVDEAAGEVAQGSGAVCLPPVTAEAASVDLSEDEKKIVDYIAGKLEGGSPPAFTDEEILTATGVSVESMNENVLRTAVMQELVRRGVDLEQLVGASTCSQLSACSVNRNLAGAQGEELERYHAEKAHDGETFTGWQAPDFSLPSTAGGDVALSDYQGRPVALVLLSGHCNHSLETLPLLAQLRQKYDPEDLAILPVYVNSGSVDDVLAWTSRMSLNYPLLIDEDRQVAEAFESYLVPSTFLIDAGGQVTSKLVGFKDRETLDRAFADLVS